MSDAEATTPWRLRPFGTSELVERVPITAAGLRLGRAADNDLVLEQRQVSSHHLSLRVDAAGGLVLENLGSLNGTFVNGARVETAELRAGDVVRIGASGPGFVVEREDRAAETWVDAGSRTGRARRRSFGKSTMIFIREAIGLEPGANVGALVQSSARRSRRLLVAAISAVVVVGGVALVLVSRESSAEVSRLAEVNERLAQQLGEARSGFAAQRAAWIEQRNQLEADRERLSARIQKLESDDRASEGELAALKRDLASMTRKLDPVTREQERLRGLDKIRRAVVYVETKITMHDSATGKPLRIVEDSSGVPRFGLEDSGALFAREGSGSGFVVSADGWVLTNAHVVEPSGYDSSMELRDGSVLEPRVSVSVVFDGESERRPAEVVRTIKEDRDDFALVRVEPFDGMPFIDDFSTHVELPETGSEVFLFGFPLGTMAIQPAGESVVGSTFKGILSRSVASVLQVDASVHPGNSGGPLTDGNGAVIGIVTAVQRLQDGQITPTIGYVIPISALDRIWPPDVATAPAAAKKGG